MSRSPTTYRCWQCQDDPAGWLELWCPETPCQRAHEHAPHGYVVRCPHWLRLHSEELRAAAQKALQKGERPGVEAQALQDLDSNVYRYQRAVTVRGREAMSAADAA